MEKIARIINKLRISRPWKYKAPFLISVPYFMIFVTVIPAETALQAIGWSFCTIIGIAGFGYLSNDYADRTEDRLAGKDNVTENMPLAGMLVLLAVLLGLAIVPWILFFPLDSLSLGLLVAEFLTFIAYSAPPFRLKERGLAGLLCDGLYAHVLPALLAARTFWLLGGEGYGEMTAFLIVLGSWQFLLGLRNILLHQIGDFERDSAAGVRTLVVQLGTDKARGLLRNTFVPMEIIAFCILLFVFGRAWLWFPVSFLGFLLILFFRRRFLTYQGMPQSLREKLNTLLDEYYSEWVPMVWLGLIGWQEPLLWVLATTHILLFPNGVKTLTREIAGRLGLLRSAS